MPAALARATLRLKELWAGDEFERGGSGGACSGLVDGRTPVENWLEYDGRGCDDKGGRETTDELSEVV